MGEELDSLSLKELQILDQQLDTALKHILTRKVIINIISVTNSELLNMQSINQFELDFNCRTNSCLNPFKTFRKR